MVNVNYKKKLFFMTVVTGTSLYVLLHYVTDTTSACSELVLPRISHTSHTTAFQRWLAEVGPIKITPGGIVNTQWQVGVRDLSYVFSAYYDSRLASYGVVRIIAIGNMYNKVSFLWPSQYCQLWYREHRPTGVTYSTMSAKIQAQLISETHSTSYGAMIFTCYLPDERRPEFVSVSSSCCVQPSNLLTIQYPPRSPNRRSPARKFTVCTAPFTQNYSNSQQLVEFMESNRVFGAEYFVLYDYEVDAAVFPYLKAYVHDSLAQVVQWPTLPVRAGPERPAIHPAGVEKPEIHAYGQVVALADCVYRHMFDTQYIVYIDLDEMIVPRSEQSWTDLIEKIRGPPSLLSSILGTFFDYPVFGAFSFQNRFFSERPPQTSGDLQTERDGRSLSPIEAYNITCLSSTEASADVFEHGVRSKYIMNPRHVVLPGIHFVFEFLDWSMLTYNVQPERAMLHHYRHNVSSVANMSNSLKDSTMLAYASEILPSIVARHKAVQGK